MIVMASISELLSIQAYRRLRWQDNGAVWLVASYRIIFISTALRGEALALEDMLRAASSRHISARTSCRLDNEVSANHPELKTR